MCEVLPVPAHALGGALPDDVPGDVALAAARVGRDRVLVDLDAVAPGPDDRHVGAGDGGNAVVRAARHLELELVREGRAVQFVLEGHGEVVGEGHGVVARPLAAGHAAAGAGCAHVRAGAAEIEPGLGELREDGLQLRGLRAEEDDVAGGTVHVGEAGAVLLPDVAQRPQGVGGIEPPRRLVHADGVELGDLGELLRDVVVTADDAAAVPLHAHDAAVLPVADLVVVRALQDAQQVLRGDVRLGALLDLLDEARPRALFQLVQFRRRLLLVSHFCSFQCQDIEKDIYLASDIVYVAGTPRSKTKF